ncbi:MAG: hypothetical protein BWY61_01481 [Firmicutes bacterium ADurb.Bin354]|nr:MAG: hypothetical protein BWY61_01481 [Firmicutes bacterium ADurb.Bin354]
MKINEKFTGFLSSQKKYTDTVIYCILALLTILRIGLYLRTPLFVAPSQVSDDALLMDHAFSILDGNWLGVYDCQTLTKGISYSLFIALCNKIFIPYSFGLALLSIGACFAMCKALAPAVNRYFCFILYLLLLYSPVHFTVLISQRIYRNAILPYTTLLLFACITAIFIRRKERFFHLLPWAMTGGLALWFFWNIKEDSFWILSFIIVIELISLADIFLHTKKTLLPLFCAIAVPFIILIAGNGIIRGINRAYYGMAIINDREEGSFSEMMTSIYSIADDTEHDSSVWVTTNMMNMAYEASPTLSLLRDDMSESTDLDDNSGEIEGDLLIWKLRYVMQQNGYFDTAAKASDFCAKVNNELNEAFADGRLQKDGKIHLSGQMKGMSLNEIFAEIPDACIRLYNKSIYHDSYVDENVQGSGFPWQIRQYEAVLGTLAEYPDSDAFSIDPEIKRAHDPAFFSNKIVMLYRHLAVPTDIIAAICYIILSVMTVSALKKKQSADILLIITGFTLSAFLVSFEVGLFTSFFSEELLTNFESFYCASCYPLIQVAKYLVIYAASCCILKARHEQSKKVSVHS